MVKLKYYYDYSQTSSHSWFRTYAQYRGCPTPRAIPSHLFLLDYSSYCCRMSNSG